MKEYTEEKLRLHQDVIMRMREGENVYPVTVEMNLTNHCNLDCPWCSDRPYRTAHRDDMNAEVAIRTIAEMERLGVRSVTLEGGGEPTLHPYFEAVVRSDRHSMPIGVITNGLRLKLLGEDIFPRLAYLRVSLDASNSKMYEVVHGTLPEWYQYVLEGLDRAVKLRGPRTTIWISYVVSGKTEAGMLAAAFTACRIGVDYIQFKPMYNIKTGISYVVDDLEWLDQVSAAGVGKTRVIMSRLNPMEMVGPKGDRRFKFCRAHRLVGAISATGDVLLCCNIKNQVDKDWSFGNLYKNTFEEIWKSEKRRKIIERVESDETFIRDVCTYCRMNTYNNAIEAEFAGGPISPMWRYI